MNSTLHNTQSFSQSSIKKAVQLATSAKVKQGEKICCWYRFFPGKKVRTEWKIVNFTYFSEGLQETLEVAQ